VLAPTSRLLELLEMLQAQPLTTGREIAQRLGIDARTVRRYIAALQALDIPVEGQRGVGGGYRVRPGYRLPPLMLNDDEAVAVVLGLIGARGVSVDRETEPVDGALAKILRVLPAPLRTQVEALEQTLGSRPRGREGLPSAAGSRCCSQRRSGAAGASAAATARSRARARSAT
jgi:predicted DNA-binding transcriptional regulator YafY